MLAAGTVGLAVWVASSPPGAPRISTLAPCFTAGCSGASVTTTTAPAPATTVPATTPAQSSPIHTAAAAPKPATEPWHSTLPQQHLQAPIISMTTLPNGSLAMVGSDGGVFMVGQAEFFGSMSGRALTQPIAAIAADPATGGYWLAARDGGIFSMHGGYYGSLGRIHLVSPIVAMVPTPDGYGYWLAAADGGVFAFGDARYAGSAARHHPTSPIVAMAATPDGRGYWLASNDGGVFTFGDAGYYGAASRQGSHSFTSIVADPNGRGYWLAGHGGEVQAYGSARPVIQPAPAIVAAAGSHAAARPAARPQAHAAGRPAKPQHIIRSSITEYRHRETGFDISQYQCAGIPQGGRPGIAIVQITGGALDNAANPCYRVEAAWAGPNLSAYMFMSGIPTPPTQSTLNGPAGTCSAADTVCQGYNYGYNYARYWIGYSDTVGVVPKLWWLDVEGYSQWSNQASNSAVIRGALDALKSQHRESGIYSTINQWNGITGGMRIPGEAEWTPGAGNIAGGPYSAQGFCAAAASRTFGGGHLKLVQWGYTGPFADSYAGPAVPFDQDYACP